MKKNIILISILLLLIAIFIFLNKESKTQSSYDLSDSTFKIEKKEDIHKIFLAYKNGGTVQLDKVDGEWIYNNKHKVAASVMRNAMDVFTRSRVSYIPPKAALKNIYKEIGLFGIKVELYGKNDNKLRSYYIGGNNMDESATFFLMEGAKQPYAMTIPGHDGNLTDRFKISEGGWRDKTIFGYEKEVISSIDVVFPKQKNISFTIINKGTKSEVHPYYKTTPELQFKTSQPNIENYFMDIGDKMAESIVPNYEKFDSLYNLVAFCEINVKLKDGTSNLVKFTPMQHKGAKGFSGVESNRFFALTSGKDVMTTQNRVVKDFFRPYDYFFMNEKL